MAIEKFPILHRVPVEKSPQKEFILISPKGIRTTVKGVRSSWNLPRLKLDKFLLEEAIGNGCKHIKEKVTDIQFKNGLWHIKTKSGIQRKSILVGADGVKSLVRKKLVGPISRDNLGVCYGCFATTKKKDSNCVKFLNKKQGSAWCFPRYNHCSIGIGTEYSNGRIIKNLFNDFLSLYYPSVKIISKWGALIPYVKNPHFFRLPCSGNNWVLVGDAAGHVDPISGEGITYALWGAELASKAIVDNALRSYDILWRKEFGDNLITGSKMRNLFYNPFLLEYSLKSVLTSDTLSKLLYDLLNSTQDYQTLPRRIVKDLPYIFRDFVIHMIK